MNIYRKRRQRPAVPIITLIDILAILLIFFIVTTTFKQDQGLISINIPKSSELSSGEKQPIQRVAVGMTSDGQVSIGDQIVPIESLAATLSEFRKRNPDVPFELKADEKAPLGSMVKVWDAAKRANIEIKDLPLRILLEK